MKYLLLIIVASSLGILSCSGGQSKGQTQKDVSDKMKVSEKLDTATLGAGCFWCVEAIFSRLKGVEKVESGYSGGSVVNPTYKEVCSGTTGHAEVARIFYNPEVVTFDQILEVFFHTHNPTTLNQQGADKGTQYRSAIFFHNEQQKAIAENKIKEVTDREVWESPIVTEITALSNYYPAEEDHQDYFENNPEQGYCSVVIAPKVSKFMKQYKDWLKPAE